MGFKLSNKIKENWCSIKRLLIVVVIIGIGLYDYVQKKPDFVSPASERNSQHNQSIASAYQNRLSDKQVEGLGVVKHILRDDSEGSRHQRFILQISSEQTVLIAHNIDLAPKINTLKKGDDVAFYGEYEWNAKGGVVHWTHHDPSGRHVGGWLKHNGRKYE